MKLWLLFFGICFFNFAIGQSSSDTTKKVSENINGYQPLFFDNHPALPFNAPVVSQVETGFLSPDKSRLFYFCFGLVLLLALVNRLFGKYMSDLFRIFYKGNFTQSGLRDQLMQNSLPSLLLNLLFFAAAGMFINFLVHERSTVIRLNFWQSFGAVTAFVALAYGIKYMLLRLSGWVLNAKELAGNYSFVVFLVNKMAGFILLPTVILMAIGQGRAAEIAQYTCLSLIALLLLYRFAVGYQMSKTKTRTNPLHFFIYFCSFELLPLALIGKLAITMLEVH